MTYKPFLDQKFLTLAMDTVVGLILYFVVKYASASVAEDFKTLFLAIQPLVALVIAGMFQADAATLKAGNTPRHLL